jgi:hypothetical protein
MNAIEVPKKQNAQREVARLLTEHLTPNESGARKI